MTEPLPFRQGQQPTALMLDDYLRLDGAGAFGGKTELIDGELYYMSPQHRPHAVAKSRLHVLLANALATYGEGLEAIVEGSIAIPPDAAPEPDIVVTNAPDGGGLIPLASVRLVVEVSDATLRFDMTEKLALYARHGVPEYWVIDVAARTIHQHWSPAHDAYAKRQTIAFGDPLASASIPGLTLATGGL